MKALKVLVIDDEQVICDACRLVLCENGHTVANCTTGRDGLMALKGRGYDLILLDMKLPDIDGSRVLAYIRENLPALPVIVMTGYSTMSNALEAMKLGAADYLSKPFSEDELLGAIDQLFTER
ncbi:MAG: response regulator [Desulfosarcina sp.]|jgi:two-component system NtrC family response regulator